MLFDNEDKVWEMTLALKKELEQDKINKGKNFDVAMSIFEYLPFFACKNIFLDNNAQKDISMYVYCQDFNIPPHSGSYKDQPSLWIQKYNIIKSEMNKREKRQIDKNKMKQGNNNGI